MLTGKQVRELREHLERAQNPIFYYDNDADGLCSFLLIRRFLGRGKGVAIRSYPDLSGEYALRAEKFKVDYVFVLDKPVLSKEFVSRIGKLGVPLIWIDHHDVPYDISYENLFIYNSAREGRGVEPTAAIVYEVLGNKNDDWIAAAGCISDCYVPVFFGQVEKKNAEMFIKGGKSAFDILYGTEFGKVVRALSYGLKDSVSNIEKMQSFLFSCNNPKEVLEESDRNIRLREKSLELMKKQENLVESAEKNIANGLLFFVYSGETSMSADIANELIYRNPCIYVCVGYEKGALTNLSLRGTGVKEVLARILTKLENASGGGHENAVGARILSKDIGRFREMLEMEIKSLNNKK